MPPTRRHVNLRTAVFFCFGRSSSCRTLNPDETLEDFGNLSIGGQVIYFLPLKLQPHSLLSSLQAPVSSYCSFHNHFHPSLSTLHIIECPFISTTSVIYRTPPSAFLMQSFAQLNISCSPALAIIRKIFCFSALWQTF